MTPPKTKTCPKCHGTITINVPIKIEPSLAAYPLTGQILPSTLVSYELKTCDMCHGRGRVPLRDANI